MGKAWLASIGILAGASMLGGCFPWNPCGQGHSPKSDRTELNLGLVVEGRELSLKIRSGYVFNDHATTRGNDLLGDTVRIVLYGEEQYYRTHINPVVTVDSQVVRMDFVESDSIIVEYGPSDDRVRVLKKKACSPIRPGVMLDSILVEKSSGKDVFLEFE